MRKINFAINEIYHIYNRGVDKRNIFLDRYDHLRFIHDLFKLNNAHSVIHAFRKFNTNPNQMDSSKNRKMLTEILLFTLMPNHFHLLIRENEKNGITKFMQKLGTGYTMYFNKKYKRVGSLFQGPFKATHVYHDSHFDQLPFYIHLNPLGLLQKNKSNKQRLQFINEYRWSSHLDYLGKNNFPQVTTRKFLLDYLGGERKYRQEIKNKLKNKFQSMLSGEIILE